MGAASDSPLALVRAELEKRRRDRPAVYADVWIGRLATRVRQAVDPDTAAAIVRVLRADATGRTADEDDLIRVVVGASGPLFTYAPDGSLREVVDDAGAPVGVSGEFARMVGYDAHTPEGAVYALFQVGEIPALDSADLLRCANEIAVRSVVGAEYTEGAETALADDVAGESFPEGT